MLIWDGRENWVFLLLGCTKGLYGLEISRVYRTGFNAINGLEQ